MTASYRPLTASDEPFLWTALYHALYVAPGDAPFPPDIVQRTDIARYVSGWMQRDGDSGSLATVGDVPVGAVWLRRWTNAERGYGWIDEQTPELSMALLPDWRGRGIGAQLLRRVLDETDAQGDAVSLSVSAENPAVRLYRRVGFVRVDREGDALTMRRPCGG